MKKLILFSYTLIIIIIFCACTNQYLSINPPATFSHIDDSENQTELIQKYQHEWAGYMGSVTENGNEWFEVLYDLFLSIKEEEAILTGVLEQKSINRSPELLAEPPQASFSARFDCTFSDTGVVISNPEWVYRTGTAVNDIRLDAFNQVNLTYYYSIEGDRERQMYMCDVAKTPVAGIVPSNDVLSGIVNTTDGGTYQISLALVEFVGPSATLYPVWGENYTTTDKIRNYWFDKERSGDGWCWQHIVYQDNEGNEYLRSFDNQTYPAFTNQNALKFASGTFTLQSYYWDAYYWDQHYMLDKQTGSFIKMQPFTLFDLDWYKQNEDEEGYMEQYQGKWTGYIDLASDTTKLTVEPDIPVQLDIKNNTSVLSFTKKASSLNRETLQFYSDSAWEILRMRRIDSVELVTEQVQHITWITFYYYHAHDFDLDTHYIVDDLAPNSDASRPVLYGVVFNEEKQEIARITLSKGN